MSQFENASLVAFPHMVAHFSELLVYSLLPLGCEPAMSLSPHSFEMGVIVPKTVAQEIQGGCALSDSRVCHLYAAANVAALDEITRV